MFAVTVIWFLLFGAVLIFIYGNFHHTKSERKEVEQIRRQIVENPLALAYLFIISPIMAIFAIYMILRPR